MRQILVAMPTN